ncbi:MAG: A/G-specific adenine glycosylase [Verrucomicrobiae bacterium]|nr:A/G-specific adenine glycosylase [Verrucomicrobiae bacterium]
MRTKNHNRSKARIIRALHTRLLAWFDTNKRDLPWRRTRDPYATLVSEIMLQQTRVTTVIPYFERWMKVFPTVESLANARLDNVLKLWAGLGYYSRARNLQKAAQSIVSRHGSKVPSDVTALQTLPGVGRYTAGAVASIAFNRVAPILDGNVIRVLSRLFLIEKDTTRSDVRDTLWQLAETIIPHGRPGDFNESLMELGALVCLPGSPLCEVCPLTQVCEAKRCGKSAELPVLRKRKPVRDVIQYALILQRGHQVLVRQRRDGELMAGLWGFPRFKSVRLMRQRFPHLAITRIGQIVHSVMNERITVCAMAASANGESPLSGHGDTEWVTIRKLRRLALPSADRQLADLASKPAVRYGQDHHQQHGATMSAGSRPSA